MAFLGLMMGSGSGREKRSCCCGEVGPNEEKEAAAGFEWKPEMLKLAVAAVEGVLVDDVVVVAVAVEQPRTTA